MSFTSRALQLASVAFVLTGVVFAQESPEVNRKVAGGGINVPGWRGKVDADAEKAGQTVNDAKLTSDGKTLAVTAAGPDGTPRIPV